MKLRKLATVVGVLSLCAMSLTSCGESATFDGQVEVVDIYQQNIPVKIGNFTTLQTDYYLNLCPTKMNAKNSLGETQECWNEKVDSSEYHKVQKGQVLEVVQNAVIVP